MAVAGKMPEFSYWFVYFEVHFSGKRKNQIAIRGNSVHATEGESFLPYSTQRKIEMMLCEYKKSFDPTQVAVHIQSFVPITRKGFLDFIDAENETDYIRCTVSETSVPVTLKQSREFED